MKENSLRKCEHRACMTLTHSYVPGILLCPNLTQKFLKRRCGLEAPTLSAAER